jgi:hypothetical protein
MQTTADPPVHTLRNDLAADEPLASDPSARLAELMALLAQGDGAALVALAHEFGGPISATVRRHLSRMGVHHVDRDELDGLVLEACLELAGCAASWQPTGGAKPWVWADRRLGAMCARAIGQHADVFDAERHLVVCIEPSLGSSEAGGSLVGDGDPLAVLGGLAIRLPRAELLLDALEQVGSPRDRGLLLDYQMQQDAGDPSPAVTVGRQYGLSAPAVRQAVRRMRRSLRELVRDDARYGELADLPLVA